MAPLGEKVAQAVGRHQGIICFGPKAKLCASSRLLVSEELGGTAAVDDLTGYSRKSASKHFHGRGPLHPEFEGIRIGNHATVAVRCRSALAQFNGLPGKDKFQRRTRGPAGACSSVRFGRSLQKRHFYTGQPDLAPVVEHEAAAVKNPAYRSSPD
jgi:hypothetical protein